MFRRIARRTDMGASAVEYGLILFAIAGVIVVVVAALGGYVEGLLVSTCDQIQASSSTEKC